MTEPPRNTGDTDSSTSTQRPERPPRRPTSPWWALLALVPALRLLWEVIATLAGLK